MTRHKAAKQEAKSTVVQMPEPGQGKGTLKNLGGSQNDDFNNVLALDLLKTLWIPKRDADGVDRQYQATLAGLVNSKPQSELEGMLIAQMIATNAAVMECFRRAMIPEQTFEGRQQNLNFANRLSRTYAAQLEALDKHRGKGQQTVRVEHVTVNAGGQAIVGNVTGGGSGKISEDQSHAKQVAHAPESEMRSPFEKNRETVPVTCDEER
jgi:hypothetical protein